MAKKVTVWHKLTRFVVTTRLEFVQSFYAKTAEQAVSCVRKNYRDSGLYPPSRRVLSCVAKKVPR